MRTPFPYETYAEDKTFYGRDEEIQKIKTFASNHSNLVLFSKRRMGKSSLIKEVFRKEKDTIFIYCDIYDIASERDFANILLSGLSNSLKGDIKSVAKKLGTLFKRVVPEFSINPQSGAISIKPATKALDFDEILEEFFSSIYKLSEDNNIVIAIDEFQQVSTIANAKIDAKLRKYMQENKNISYVFLGSKRHMLNNLFEYGSPLFEMATPFLLMPLKVEDIYSYSSKYLKISIDTVKYMYELADAETRLMQHICNILYLVHEKTEIDKEHVDEALVEILNSKSHSFKVIFDTFSQQQKKAFKAIARGKRNVYSKDTLDSFDISKPTMKGSLEQLFKREIIDKEDDVWFIPDRALELWGRGLN